MDDAGDRAVTLFAYSDAELQYRTAAELARELGDAEKEAEALEKQGAQLYLSARYADALELLERAARLYQDLGDQERYLGTVSRIGHAHVLGGTAQAGIERILPVVRALTRMGLSYLLIRRGRWGEARSDAERAVKEARGVGESWMASYPFRSLGWLCLLHGERDTGVAHLQESLAMAERMNDFQGILGAQKHLVWLDVREGKPQDAIGRLAPLRRRLEEQGLPAVFPVEAKAHIELGNLGRARALTVKGEARLELVEVLTVSAALATRQGRWDDALHDLEEGLGFTKEIGLPYDEALLLYEYGRMHAAKGEPELARERLEQALAIFQRLGAMPDVERTEQALAESVVRAESPS